MQAITLSRRDFREADQIVSLITNEVGKLELLARGVKKITSKNSASLEPFSLVKIEIAKGKEIDHLTTANGIEFFKSIRDDLKKTLQARYLVYLVDKLVEVGNKEQQVFSVLLESLNYLAKEAGHALFVPAFVIKLMVSLGFSPEIKQCSGCGNKSARTYFDIAGGVVCVDCSKKQANHRSLYKLNDRLLSALQASLEPQWKELAVHNLEQRDRETFNELAYNFACYHTGRRLNDWRDTAKILHF